uniref:NUT midline carcinoma family member 1 n=1 Tax=Pelusios castaneus TaxID=367368 RepID=A0A8C8RGF5_9SAUR
MPPLPVRTRISNVSGFRICFVSTRSQETRLRCEFPSIPCFKRVALSTPCREGIPLPSPSHPATQPSLPTMSSQPRQVPPLPPPLLVPAFPGTALLLTSPDAPGGKLIVKLKPEGTQEPPRTQTIILAGVPAGWAPPRRDGAPLRFQLAAGIRTIMLSKAEEQPGPKEIPPVYPAQALPPGDSSASCTSKGVYENYRRWQRYKALAWQHFPGTPDAEALACFFIPVLRSLSRLRPELAPEEGVLRAVQEWERSSNFERMIFYEMAEKFMEFEAEEELQIQKMKLLSSSRFQPPPVESSKPLASDPDQQQGTVPGGATSFYHGPLGAEWRVPRTLGAGWECPPHPPQGPQATGCILHPRRRQRRTPGPSVTGESREIPPEAVRQYAEIMEGLRHSWEEEDGEASGHGEPQSQVQGALPDPGLLHYLEQLCEDESFVCKVEAVIHPQFLAQLLSPEKRCDPLNLSEELEQELGLTPSQVSPGSATGGARVEGEQCPPYLPTVTPLSYLPTAGRETSPCLFGRGAQPPGMPCPPVRLHPIPI